MLKKILQVINDNMDKIMLISFAYYVYVERDTNRHTFAFIGKEFDKLEERVTELEKKKK